ncbi:MAG: hypothetical protein KAR44_14890 [Candidatus Aegiribacteria sp.]|nr:hypothetical protein [Candidatus Aegiribacteria sp.]
MTGAQLLTYIRRKTHATAAMYSDADILIDVNQMIEELAVEIQKVREHIWEITYLDDLVLDTRNYAFQANILNRMTDLELMFAAGDNYVHAHPTARRHYNDVLQESVIVNNFDNSDPEYFIRKKELYILSGAIIAVTNGIKIVYSSFPATLANLTGSTCLSIDPSATTHGFPREFHKLLARKIVREYKDLHTIKLNKFDLDFEDDMEKKLDAFSVVNTSRTIKGGLPVTNSDNGFDY